MTVVVLIVVCGLLLGAVALGYGLGSSRRPASADEPEVRPTDDLSATLLTVLGHGVVVLDRDERVVLVNPAAGVLGVLDGDRLAFPELVELARTAIATKRPVECSVDLPLDRLGREPIALSVRAVPLGVPDVEAVAMLLDDVTDLRRLEAVRRDFVANVSHELKTPVGALTLLAEAVIDAADDPEAVQRFAGRMQHEGARLGRLVRELIELSRLQGAEPLPGDQLVDVGQVVEEAADRTRLAAESAGIELRVSCPSELQVRGSESQLAMALANLVDNAVAYSPRGTRVSLTARAVDDAAGPGVEIGVSDQGIGIADTDLTRVFERFYRVDPARSRATGGTGLGLAIVKHVATNHGGSVSVWSAEGAGSTFTVRLPRVHPATGSSTPQALAVTSRGTA